MEPNAEDDRGNVEEMDNDDDDHESNEDESDDDDSVFDAETDDGLEDEIVEEFIRTFHNCNYDMEFDNALKLDRSVIPSARPTQASYIKPDIWQDRNRIGLEMVKEQLQNLTDSVSHDQSFQLKLTHNIFGQLMDNEEPIVWHEPILDRRWDVLEAEIDRMRQLGFVTDIDGIQITNVEMKKERLAALLAIFRNGSATNANKYLHFNNVNLCKEGIASLSKLVDVSVQLQIFRLHHNRFDSIESARCLSRSLKLHSSIIQLNLNHCDIGSSPEILLLILQSDIKYIDLASNNIDSLGVAKIAEGLGGDLPIEELSLANNRLNDDDVILISQALKLNTYLRHLNLERNNFTSIGVKALLTCVFDSSSLNAISESNHTLNHLFIFSEEGYKLHRCIGGLLQLDRTDKILLALLDKDSLLKYLANIPVELIPEVLAFPHEWFDNLHQQKHLTVVYSTMRWWNMPLLYSYHNCVQSDAKRKRSN